jgi:hypothetical protein
LDEGIAGLGLENVSPPRVEYDPASPLNGLIRRLTVAAGGNVCDRGVVAVTAATTEIRRFGDEWNGGRPEAVVDQDTEQGWYDMNKNPSWLMFDFKAQRVGLESYTIRFGTEVGTNPQKWRVEASDDAATWKVVDDRQHETVQRMAMSIHHLDCQQTAQKPARYIRFVVEVFQYYWGGNYQMGMTAIELFGIIETPET